MSEELKPILDRLRRNLQINEIPASDDDIRTIEEKGFLQTPLLFAKLVQDQPIDVVPDYLGAWQPPAAPEESTTPSALPETPAPDILATAAKLRRGETSAVALTEAALAAINEVDGQLNAFQLVARERALQAAQRADQALQRGEDRGPLHGIPVAIKDLLHWAGTTTTAGSIIRASEIVQENAAAVDKLEAAGAIIVGKTRMSEFAYAPASINPHYGQTRNPRNLAHDTGGSSSGSGAAVAAGQVFAALGSDTGGSIRIPAAHCGLAGLKPTFGRISLYGAINLAWSLDHVGPLTRTVADSVLVLAALEGEDPRDARTRAVAPLPVNDLLQQEPNLRGLRIGVLRDDGSGEPLASPDAMAAWQSGLDRLAAAGATLVEIDMPDLRTMWVVGGAILAQEALAYHLPNLKTRLHEFGGFMRPRILAAFAYEPGAFVRGQQLRGTLRRRAEEIFKAVDLLSTPSMPAPAPLLGIPSPTTLTMPFNLLGWPALTVPVGQTETGLPLGLQLSGRPWDDATVLRAGLALERS